MNFVANFIRFPAMQKFENRLRFDKVTQNLKVRTFWHTLYKNSCRLLSISSCFFAIRRRHNMTCWIVILTGSAQVAVRRPWQVINQSIFISGKAHSKKSNRENNEGSQLLNYAKHTHKHTERKKVCWSDPETKSLKEISYA